MKNIFNIENGFKALVILLLATIAFGTKAADFSGSVSVSSDYVWRGVTQTDNGSHANLNLELSQSGFTVGAWAGTVDFGDDNDVETDWYIEYSKELLGADVTVGYNSYVYSSFKDIVAFSNGTLDFEEIYVVAEFDKFFVAYAMGQDEAPDYTSLGTSLLKVVDVSYGDYDGIGSNITVSRSLGKGFKADYIRFSADEASGLVDDNNFVLSYSYNF